MRRKKRMFLNFLFQVPSRKITQKKKKRGNFGQRTRKNVFFELEESKKREQSSKEQI